MIKVLLYMHHFINQYKTFEFNTKETLKNCFKIGNTYRHKLRKNY